MNDGPVFLVDSDSGRNSWVSAYESEKSALLQAAKMCSPRNLELKKLILEGRYRLAQATITKESGGSPLIVPNIRTLLQRYILNQPRSQLPGLLDDVAEALSGLAARLPKALRV